MVYLPPSTQHKYSYRYIIGREKLVHTFFRYPKTSSMAGEYCGSGPYSDSNFTRCSILWATKFETRPLALIATK